MGDPEPELRAAGADGALLKSTRSKDADPRAGDRTALVSYSNDAYSPSPPKPISALRRSHREGNTSDRDPSPERAEMFADAEPVKDSPSRESTRR